MVKREREVMILPEDRFGRELTASSKENVVTPLICCVSTQSLTLVDILLCVSIQFVLCCALFLAHSISDYAIVSQSWIARKIPPRCDELVAVGWRTFAAKGRLESRFALPEFAANALRNQCAVWYNSAQSEK